MRFDGVAGRRDSETNPGLTVNFVSPHQRRADHDERSRQMGMRFGCPSDDDMVRVGTDPCDSVSCPARPESKDTVLTGKWEMKIVGNEIVDADQLMGHPENAKIHPLAQQKSMDSVLSRVGWIQNVIVNQRTGRILDGHMRVAMAISAGEPVPVSYVDLNEDQERLAVATFDHIAVQSVLDDEMFGNLVAQIPDVDEAIAKLFATVQKDVPKPKDTVTPEDVPPSGELEDFVFGMVGWSEIKVKSTGDEISELTEVYQSFRAEQGGSDKGFVEWLISHVSR